MLKLIQIILKYFIALLAVLHMAYANAFIFEANNINNNRPLTVAVASNFKYTLEQIISTSEYWSQQNIRIVTGSSGMLYAQIIKGAPFDLFLSADSQQPLKLVNEGLGTNATVYAIGRLALWPASSSVKLKTDQKVQLSYLEYLGGIGGKLAIANPQLAPFGKAALEVIHNEPAIAHLKGQLVTGNNVNQAFQFVDSGNAQAGLIAESLLIQAKQLLGTNKYDDYILIPSSQYATIEQSIVLLKPNALHPQSESFMNFLLGEHTQALLPQFGYNRP